MGPILHLFTYLFIYLIYLFIYCQKAAKPFLETFRTPLLRDTPLFTAIKRVRFC
ncbi:hypothetical protein XSR1_40026 [Xenorhabdus szentirmaii DSM 16338]|uniref:Uncharacterized protein n=1 Tax=Xenorhabdus szentirmaii DSM 16338 TaxID=1427518 RepID=W1IZV9_9GAMM|nr:hypothetical protein XSR1_40026 [Xenorhabdus szentirmaii DSM 16338]